MRHRTTNALLGAATVLVSQLAGAAAERPNWQWLIVCDGPDGDRERAALIGALRLLPLLPARVAVIDATEAKPDVQPTLLKLEAFILQGSPVVYVVKQSALLRGAVAGSTFHTHALAAVLWHEMAHAEGADEREARKERRRALGNIRPRSAGRRGDRAPLYEGLGHAAPSHCVCLALTPTGSSLQRRGGRRFRERITFCTRREIGRSRRSDPLLGPRSAEAA